MPNCHRFWLSVLLIGLSLSALDPCDAMADMARDGDAKEREEEVRVKHTSTFASIRVTGPCEFSIKYVHPLDVAPPHEWKVLPKNLVSRLSKKESTDLTEFEAAGIADESDYPSDSPDDAPLLMLVAGSTSSTSTATPSIAWLFRDPRYKVLHGFHGDNALDPTDHHSAGAHYSGPGSPTEHKSYVEAEGSEQIWFPGHVDEFSIYCHNTSTRTVMKLSAEGHPKQRPFSTMAATDDIKVITQVQAGPPSTQLNIIFLAGGFTASQKQMFLDNVTALTEMMMDPKLNPRNLPPDASSNLANMHRSVPLNRYWPFFNVYAVWQPSVDEGASRPLIGLIKNTNLKCQHPQYLERAVNCDRDLAMALADTTPARPLLNPDRSLIIAIVNTPIYGGSGVFIKNRLHMGNFFNGYDLSILSQKERMLSLMDHECGHSFGDLMDEYDVGSSDTTGRVLKNCQAGSGGAPPVTVQWQHWIDIARADPTGWVNKWGNGLTGVDAGTDNEWGVLSIPQAVCGYQNYYKPSQNCMMNRLNNFFMCPICREQESLSIMANTFQLSWPRRPLPDTVILIPKNLNDSTTVNFETGVILHLPVYLTAANSYKVTFYDTDGTILPFDPKPECPVCVRLNKTHFQKYPVGQRVFINVTIEDQTVFVTPQKRGAVQAQLNQSTYFQLMVVNSVQGLPNVTLEPGSLSNVYGKHDLDVMAAYLMCQPVGNTTPICSMNFTSKDYEAPLNLDSAFDDIEYWVYGVVGGLAVLFLLLWLYAANRYKKSSDGRPRPILKTQFGCFISTVRGIMMLSAAIFMLAALGTMGLACWYYTQTSALGKIIIFAGMALAVGLYIMSFIGYWSVSSRSKKMLLVNGMVLFIGLAILVAAGVLITYIGEDMKNEKGFWTEQLQTLWRSTVDTYPDRACAIEDMLSCSGFNHSCSDVVGSSLDCPINCERTNNRYYEPCRNMLRNYINDNYETIIYIIGGAGGLLLIGIMFNFITFCALVKAKAEIRQQHKKALASFRQNKSGKGAQDRHKALYILKSLGSNDTDALIKEFQRMDADGSGTLSKKEMFMFLKGTMCYRATADEINCIFELADVDNSGTISLHEFLAIFGRRAPVSKATPMRRQDQAALVRQRMRSQFAGTDLYDARDDEYFGSPSMACSPSGGYDVQHSISSPGMLHTPSGTHQSPVMGTVHLRPIESMPHYAPAHGGSRAYQQREQDIDDLL